MSRHELGWSLLFAALLALPACAAGDTAGEGGPDGTGEADDGPVGTARQGITVSGFGHYCNANWPTGGWAFNWYTSATSDPCTLLNWQSTGGHIERAGIYSTTGLNNVVVRCDGFVGQRRGYGGDPLAAAFTDAGSRSNCSFTVAPMELRILDAPFDTANVSYTPGTGVDFARWPITTLDVTQFGQTGSTAATVVDRYGRDKSNLGFVNDHDGYDWGMPRGTPILAVADGIVRKARFFNTGCSGSDSPYQGEIYVDHTINRSPSTYNETFRASYFHLQGLNVADGQVVTKGQVIGYSGNRGCSSGPHLHFVIFRMSNTAVEWHPTHTIDANGNDGYRLTMDPYGWYAPAGFDPWAWRAYGSGMGALSIWLWNAGQAPSSGTW